MSATYQFVEIPPVSYPVYSDVAMTDEYLAADAFAEAYRDADDLTKIRWIVTSTRTIDSLSFPGTKFEDTQELDWPRKDTGLGYLGVQDDVIPQDIVTASMELTNALANGFDIQVQSTAQTTKRLKAGSVEIEYFRGAEGLPIPFPLSVWRLLAPYLGGGPKELNSGSIAYGTCGRTAFDQKFGFNQGI